MSDGGYELRIERLIDAPAEVVFDTFVEPEAQRELYGNDDDPRWIVESELDLQVGGIWTIVFGTAGEDPYRETNVFSEVDRPRRLVFDSSMLMIDDGRTVETTVTVTFHTRGSKTLLTILQSGFERVQDRDDLQGGWPSIVDALERIVAQKQRNVEPRNEPRSERGATR